MAKQFDVIEEVTTAAEAMDEVTVLTMEPECVSSVSKNGVKAVVITTLTLTGCWLLNKFGVIDKMCKKHLEKKNYLVFPADEVDEVRQVEAEENDEK